MLVSLANHRFLNDCLLTLDCQWTCLATIQLCSFVTGGHTHEPRFDCKHRSMGSNDFDAIEPDSKIDGGEHVLIARNDLNHGFLANCHGASQWRSTMHFDEDSPQPLQFSSYTEYLSTIIALTSLLDDHGNLRKPQRFRSWSRRCPQGESEQLQAAIASYEAEHPQSPFSVFLKTHAISDEVCQELRILFADRAHFGSKSHGVYLEDLIHVCHGDLIPGRSAIDRFRSTGALVRNGIVKVETPDGARFISSVVRITDQAFAEILGEEHDSADFDGLAPEDMDELERLQQRTDPRLSNPENIELVLPSEDLARLDMIAAWEERERQDLNPRYRLGSRLVALLEGAPGTGKTLAASYVAAKRGCPLLTVASHDVLNCYVGGTERRLRTAFETARDQNAVLLLDEVDSLGSSRDGADRRYEVSFTNTLLDLVERHKGIVMLTTNRVDVLDHALESRLTYRFALALPKLDERARLWEIHLREAGLVSDPAMTPDDLAALGQLSGREIRSAVERLMMEAEPEDSLITIDCVRSQVSGVLRSSWSRKSIGFGS